MRKLFYAVLLFCLPLLSRANPGDTSWVQANNVQLNYYNNFDTGVRFPDGSKSYRKIYMIFTLGKYACPGSPQYCGDWDYTVQTYFMGMNRPDTFELGRLITPYAHTGSYRFSATWTNRYIFDVTDYYPVLKDTGTIRIHYSGYSGGFTGNVQFAFIEGTPERSVLRVDRLWHGDFAYGHGSTPINTALSSLSQSAPSGTYSAEVKMNITGHGGDDRACAEFCPNTYSLAMNGSGFAQQPFFRTDCSANDLSPQTGTWIYARANWCPGALVRTFTHKLPITPLTGGAPAYPYTMAMSFPAYTSTTNTANTSYASYTIDGAVIYYGTYAKTLDASLEDIIAPTKAEYRWRQNPISLKPVLSVRNDGGTAITSIKFNYSVQNHFPQSYTWSGNIAPLETTEISLPVLGQLRLAAGDYGFWAAISSVNGSADVDPNNNYLSSTFTAAPTWPADLQIQLKANNESLPANPSVCQTAWRIEDAAGNVVVRRNDCPLGTLCDTTFHLQDGAYQLIVTDTAYEAYYDASTGGSLSALTGTGLNGFSSPTGYMRTYDASTGNSIPMSKYFSGNFGSGFVQQFFVGEPLAVANTTLEKAVMKSFPNPATKTLSVVVDGLRNAGGILTLTDMLGREALRYTYHHGIVDIPVDGLQAGIYILSYTGDAGTRTQQRVIIAR